LLRLAPVVELELALEAVGVKVVVTSEFSSVPPTVTSMVSVVTTGDVVSPEELVVVVAAVLDVGEVDEAVVEVSPSVEDGAPDDGFLGEDVGVTEGAVVVVGAAAVVVAGAEVVEESSLVVVALLPVEEDDLVEISRGSSRAPSSTAPMATAEVDVRSARRKHRAALGGRIMFLLTKIEEGIRSKRAPGPITRQLETRGLGRSWMKICTGRISCRKEQLCTKI
jgi:hypothetical protein